MYEQAHLWLSRVDAGVLGFLCSGFEGAEGGGGGCNGWSFFYSWSEAVELSGLL